MSNTPTLELSTTQLGLWLIDQADESNAFNLPLGFDLRGVISKEVLETAFRVVIERHSLLRSYVDIHAERPRFIVGASIDVPFIYESICQQGTKLAFSSALSRAKEEASRRFDLTSESPLRAILIQYGDEAAIFVCTFHHIAVDGWASDVFVQELSAAYNSIINNGSLDLKYDADTRAKLPPEERVVPLKEMDEALDYFRANLAGAPPVINLPVDRARRSHMRRPSSWADLEISPKLLHEIESFAKSVRVTPFVVIHAALAVVLSRWTGQDDIVIGTVAANREDGLTHRVIDLFANVVPLRTRLERDMTVGDLLDHSRNTVLEAICRQRIPFRCVVEAIAPDRSANYTPIFQVMLAFEAEEPQILSLDGAICEGVDLREGLDAQYDLAATFIRRPDSIGGGLSGKLQFDSDLFRREKMERFAKQVRQALVNICQSATDSYINSVEILDLPEKKFLLDVVGRGKKRSFPRGLSAYHMFEKQAYATPGNAALVEKGKLVTYASLLSLVKKLAGLIARRQSAPASRIGIALGKGIVGIAAQLATWKIGGGFLTLDPDLPPDRLQYMVLDAEISLLITTKEYTDRLPGHISRIIVDNQEIEEADDGGALPARDTILSGSVTEKSLACLVYTSGSTGRPKGVAFHHQGIINLATEFIERFDIDSNSRVLQLAALNFDASLAETVMALFSGACLVLAPRDETMPGTPLAEAIRAYGVSHLIITPSALSVIENQLDSVGVMIVAGEQCSADLSARWTKGRLFFDAYGPTESTVCATVSDRIYGAETPNIGRPISNAYIYIVDQHLRLAPLGVPGEILIGGVGVTLGYVGQQRLTDERYIANPFHTSEGLVYRSGDYAVWQEDGTLKYLGRMDQQVKIRGSRIELSEIQSVVSQHEDVSQVIIACIGEGMNKQIVAYIVSRSGNRTLTPADLRAYCANTLPEYMLPSCLVWLDEIPLTHNGKVDHAMLPSPSASRLENGKLQRPQTYIESALSSLFAEVLGLESVGVNEDFFDLGGHSLLAAKLVTRMRATFAVDIPVRILFEAPTVEALASRISPSDNEMLFYAKDQEWHRDDMIASGLIFGERDDQMRGNISRNILVTGASGLLGSALVMRILADTNAEICCLLRGKNQEEAQEKLINLLAGQPEWSASYLNRIQICVGNIGLINLGLPLEQYERLVESVDTIFHCAAEVNFLKPYASLRGSNVVGTLRILEFASSGREKTLFHISSLSVFPDGRAAVKARADEEPLTGDHPLLEDGYSQTKWVSDRMVSDAFARGLRGQIYRPGRICGDSRTGVWQEKDFFCRLLKTCVLTGVFPVTAEVVRMLPVDQVSKVMLLLSSHETSAQVFHVDDDQPVELHQIYEALCVRGYELQELPLYEWKEQVLAQDRENPERLPADIIEFVHQLDPNGIFMEARESNVDLRRTKGAIGGTNGLLEGPSLVTLAKYFSYLEKVGFLPPPNLCRFQRPKRGEAGIKD